MFYERTNIFDIRIDLRMIQFCRITIFTKRIAYLPLYVKDNKIHRI